MSLTTIPIFPLPGLVLFPRTVMPLHIFEPRFVRLVTSAIESDYRIASANLRKGWEKDYFGAPPANRVVTIARVLHHEKLPDRRFNILLEGIERAALVDELQEKPFRVGRVLPLPDLMDDEDREAIRVATRELTGLAAQIAEYAPEQRGVLTNLDNQHLHPGIIADQVAAALVRESYDRQCILEQRRVLRRIELVNVQLRIRLAQLVDEAPADRME